MTDQLDDQIRDLLAAERERAPLPHPWHDVVATSDRRHAGLHRGLVLVTAAVVVLGVLGLFVLTSLRVDDDERADVPPDTGPATTTSAPAVEDPLADLAATDWVVPDPIPTGYRLAIATGVAEFDHRTLVFESEGRGAEVQLTMSPGSRTVDDDTALELDGVTWYEQILPTITDRDLVTIWRPTSTGTVSIFSLDSAAGRDVLLTFAQALTPVGGDEIDFEVLTPDGPFTTVATMELDAGPVTMTVRGLNGYFCVRTDYSSGSAAGGGCASATSPAAPFLPVLGGTGPAGSFTAGLVEPGVASIDVTGPGGEMHTVVPVDESGQYEQLFWLAPGFPSGLGQDLLAVTLHLEDGSSVDLEKSPLGRWLVPAGDDAAPGSTVPAAADPLADLGDGDWAVPSVLPDGVRRSWADVSSDGSSRTQRFFTDHDRDESPGTYIALGATSDPGVGEIIEIDGIAWVRTATDDESGDRFTIQRVAGGRVVSVGGWNDDAELLRELAARLVAVPEDELDFGVVDPNGTYTEVASIEVGTSRFALEVVGGQGRYCTRLIESGTDQSGWCIGFVTDIFPLVDVATERRADANIVAGYALSDVTSLAIVTSDGGRIEVETVEAAGLDDRFWLVAAPTSVDLRSRALTIEITRTDGSTDLLRKNEFQVWAIVEPDDG